MCGIVGAVSSNQQNQRSHIKKMLEKLVHRGPDGSGVVESGYVLLGHRRLAILDLSNDAKQPMWDTDKRFCLTFNGEIYNHIELKKELSQLGYHFRTRSDTEVLLNAWKAWGTATLNKLVGMFTFAIWDVAESKLFIARDRMGEKPLFYTGFSGDIREGLIFASELKSLVMHPAVKKNISLEAISEFLSQNYLLTETCIFDGIYKLPPAHFLVYHLGREPILQNYWLLEHYFQQKSLLSFDEAKEQLRYLIKQATLQETYADVNVGAFLSGGIDSSTIVAEMAKQGMNHVHTFSIGFAEKTYNELPISQIAANHLQVMHKAKIIYPQIDALLPHLVYAHDEPFADTSMIPTYLLSQFARQYVKVSLSGDGGDELFGGYSTYQANRWHRYAHRLPKSLLQFLQQSISKIPTSFSKVSLDYKLKAFLRGCTRSLQEAHAGWRAIFSVDEKIRLFHPEYKHFAQINPFQKIKPFFQQVKDCHFLDQAMFVDMKTWLVDDVLVKVDRGSMAHSLEVRAPFLDHRLVEFAASLPIHFKIKGNTGKYILKKSQGSFLPKVICNRRKEGFNAPLAFWLNNELYDMAYSYTMSQRLFRWFDKIEIETLWKQHKMHHQDHSLHLFGLLNLALWIEAFKV